MTHRLSLYRNSWRPLCQPRTNEKMKVSKYNVDCPACLEAMRKAKAA